MDDAKTDTMNLYRVNTKPQTTEWPVYRPWTRQLLCVENLPLMGHPVMLAVLKDTMEGTLRTVSDLPSLIGKDTTGQRT